MARCLHFAIRNKDMIADVKADGERQIIREESENELSIVTRSSDIKTLDDLISFCDIDLDTWEVYKFLCNSWGNEDNECFQVKAFLRRKVPGFDMAKQIALFREQAAAHAPKYEPIQHEHKTGNMLEMSLPDFHFGQLSWGKETGRANYDIKIATDIYREAVSNLLHHAKPYTPEKIIFMVGSDFFNVNNQNNTTTGGTPQDEDGRWQKTFTYGRQLVVSAVDMCREIADVEVVVIPGNHDTERSFYLGDSLACWYNQCNNVKVNNDPSPRKYIRWGKNLIGMTHGSEEKTQMLPLIMATEAPDMWAKTVFREFHIGHLHHKRTFAFVPVQEENGVRVRILPSLCARDAWHTKKGFESIRQGQAFLWNETRGCIAEFNFVLEK
jgi:hypothetical protein